MLNAITMNWIDVAIMAISGGVILGLIVALWRQGRPVRPAPGPTAAAPQKRRASRAAAAAPPAEQARATAPHMASFAEAIADARPTSSPADRQEEARQAFAKALTAGDKARRD